MSGIEEIDSIMIFVPPRTSSFLEVEFELSGRKVVSFTMSYWAGWIPKLRVYDESRNVLAEAYLGGSLVFYAAADEKYTFALGGHESFTAMTAITVFSSAGGGVIVL
jgi:hypothetical protein